MSNERKKITAYLHPEIYGQDARAGEHIDSVPYRLRGNFYRESIIVGAALSTLDPRLLPLISGMFSRDFTAGNLKSLIAQVLGDDERLVSLSSADSSQRNPCAPVKPRTPSVEDREKAAWQNLNKLRF